jgi:soluble lytic murein transglycosylase-like protein
MRWALYITGGYIMARAVLPSVDFKNRDEFDPIIRDASARYGVPALLVKAVVATESGFRQGVTNDKTSASGLMQVTKAAAKTVGADHDALTQDARAEIMAGTAYLSDMIDKFGLYDGVRAYWGGPGTVSQPNSVPQWMRKGSYDYAGKVASYWAALALNPEAWV